jgi:hypothetical protein
MLGFHCVNDEKDVEGGSLQVMICILCYGILIQALKIEKINNIL